jgi:flagellar biosynthesis protein FliP
VKINIFHIHLFLHFIIIYTIWEIWNIRNKLKYNQSRIGDQAMFNNWKNNLRKHLQCTLQTSHINEIDKNKLELFRNNNLHLPMQSVHITSNVASSNPAQARCTRYNIM